MQPVGMMLPAIQGLIRRRVLVNFRVDPSVMRKLVPESFELQLVDGWAIAGLCLIRLERMRPAWMPVHAGLASESVAYRVAVAGPDGSAVYVPRRDTDSRLQVAAGGRLFPARFGRSAFRVLDDGSRLDLDVRSFDGLGDVRLVAQTAAALPASSVFGELATASRFFESGGLAWTPSSAGGRFDVLELRTREWAVSPLAVEVVQSSFYDDPRRFPRGSITFDNALLMRNVRHEWRAA